MKNRTMITGEWIEQKLKSGFNRDDLRLMLTSTDHEADLLYRAARKVRDEVFGRKAFIRAVVEFANSCRCSCLYCGMRLNNPDGIRFSLDHQELLAIAQQAYDNGIRTFFLQAAESESYGAIWLRDVIADIKALGMGVLLCVGVHQEDDLELWRKAGAYKFILKHETSDRELFEKMKPGFTLDGRIEWLKTLRRYDYHIGSGPLLGLPGQTIDSLVEDLFLLRDLQVEMSSVSVFLPAAGTPLENEPTGDPELGLRFIAAMRLFLKTTLIPATSTFERLLENGQYRCFEAGANVITVNMTPQKLRDEYTIYSDRFYVGLEHARNTIRKAGLQETTEGELLS
ncbi:MAG: [FeFe] hydrogenase H-cluster radical SAM maturase HydE [Candidatus Sabulitectum sp.]|nr:[FeFe] hydrogenase H-cluster radical SAM maturase HydE [Candidatus Sabulitectum sp.]